MIPALLLSTSDDPIWRQNDMGWNVVPKGLYDYLLWIAKRYNNPLLYITENGSAEHEPTLASAVADGHRQDYIRDHIRACAAAIHDGSNLMGYFVWSLLDNFEWGLGYERRFGIVRVNFETLQRTLKGSAKLYRDIIHTNSKESS
jgi:beta-glucosidase/6-phospho-beta-glucosidase/beta-galactosidase